MLKFTKTVQLRAMSCDQIKAVQELSGSHYKATIMIMDLSLSFSMDKKKKKTNKKTKHSLIMQHKNYYSFQFNKSQEPFMGSDPVELQFTSVVHTNVFTYRAVQQDTLL